MDNNLKKKNKFINNVNNEYNKQPHYYVPINDNRHNPNYNNKSKISVELNQNFDPYNYELNYTNTTNTNNTAFTYFSPYNQGPGRGFGNLNINNDIRNSAQSRQHTNEFRVNRESESINRFEYIDNRYSNPNNFVLPFPRSGETTRKFSEMSYNINDYNFSKPNQVKITNLDFGEINYDFNQLPNNNLVNDAKQVGIRQKNRQKEKLDTDQLNTNQFKYDNNPLNTQYVFNNDLMNYYSNVMNNLNQN